MKTCAGLPCRGFRFGAVGRASPLLAMAISRGLRSFCSSASRMSFRRRLSSDSHRTSDASLSSQQIPSQSSPTPAVDSSSPSNNGNQNQIPGGTLLSEEVPRPDFIPLSEESSPKQHRVWSAVKAILTGSLVAGAIVSGYVSYAYTSDDVSKKISEMRKSSSAASQFEDKDLLQKFQNVLYSASMKGVVGVAELYLETRRSIEDHIKGFAAPASDKLLPDLHPQERHVFTLVLDLNETLVYSDWTRDRGWRTFKRPGAEAFLEHLAQYYELVVYTDQLPFTVDPILEKLDQKGCIRYRLAREATQYIHGKHYKDLSKLNRDPAHVLFLSAHAKDTCLQPENAVPIKPWKLEPDDTLLLDYLPFFEYVARYRPADIRPVLASYDGHDIPSEFLARTKDYQRKMRQLKSQNPFFRGSKN